MKTLTTRFRPLQQPLCVLCSAVLLITSAGVQHTTFAQQTGQSVAQPGAPKQDSTRKQDSARKQDSSGKPERPRLEVIEDLSESLANDMLELSVATRDRNINLTADFFPPQLTATRFPSRPLRIKNHVKWIGLREWEVRSNAAADVRSNKTPSTASGTVPGAPSANGAEKTSNTNGIASAVAATTSSARKLTKQEFLRDWQTFLDHFAEIDDVRFKVKEAQFDTAASAVANVKVPTAVAGSTGQARLAFYVIGRNREGQREWARGVANVVARYGASGASGRWQFTTFALASLDSMVAATDLFSEVAVPAGVAANRPAYGSPGNSGFVWHGAAAADFNKDGWMDLFATAPDRNFLYLNDQAGRFRDASGEAGIELLASGTAPLALDYDNDGDSDVFISAVGSQVLMENRLVPDGKFEFRDVSSEAGVGVPAIGFSAAAGDVNADGRMDIYVACYNRYGQVTPNSWFRATNGTPNLLFVNQGDGTFREEAAKWGVDDHRWSYAAAFADVNGDGRQDLYVANDFGEKTMFINKGNRFVDEAAERGVLDPGNGMGVSFGDYNNDGRLDLHSTNMSSTAGNRILSRLFPQQTAKDNVLKKLAAGNNLFENTGDGKYRDVTTEVGGFSGGWAWGGGFIDFDNDGWEDLFTPNGFISGKSMKDT